MIIKKACKIDLDNILSLLILVKLPIEGVSNQLENFFISVIDDTLIGCVGLEIYGESGLIRSLAVHPSHQRKGVGKLLIQSILKYAKDKDINQLYLLTTTANDYFIKHGFTIIKRDEVNSEIKESVEFKSVCPLTAVCMKRVL